MSDFWIKHEWQPALRGESPEVASTFARLQMGVGDHLATRVEDATSKTTADAIYVSLYPFAEWVVANWWCLLNEMPDWATNRVAGFDERHSMAYAADGFAWPNVEFAPVGDRFRVRWLPYESPLQRVRFVGSSEALVEREQVEDELRTLVEYVLDRIESQDIRRTWLQQAWPEIVSIEPEAADYCRTMALMGVNPHDVSEGDQRVFEQFCQGLEDVIRDEALRNAAPADLERLRVWIDEGRKLIRDSASHGSGWSTVVKQLGHQNLGEEPWRRGFALARQARKLAGLGHEPFDPLKGNGLAIRLVPGPPAPVRGIKTIASTDRSKGPSCLGTRLGLQSQRFACARSLGQYLADGRNNAALVTDSLSVDQQFSRAFAAEFLAPAAAIRDGLPATQLDDDDIDLIADHFGVSAFVIALQVHNHRLGQLVGQYAGVPDRLQDPAMRPDPA